MVVYSGAVSVEDTRKSDRQVNFSLDAGPYDDDVGTVRAYSDDRHSYADTIVRVLRGGSELRVSVCRDSGGRQSLSFHSAF